MFLVPWDEFALIPSDYEKRYYVLTKVLHSSSPFFFFVFMTRVGFVHIYRWCRWGSVKTPPHAVITVEDVPWVVLLQSDSLLLVFGPGQQVHSLPSVLDRYRMRAITINLTIAMQEDRIVGQ